jgi:uncharacterized protein (DUF4415 family)
MRRSLSEPDEENPEWTAEDMRNARPAMEVLPKAFIESIERYQRQRRLEKRSRTEMISLRVDRDVLDAFRATGKGWQMQANEALRAYMKKGLVKRRRPAVKRRAKKTRRAVAKRA